MEYKGRKLILTENQIRETLGKFYKNVANAAGYTETENTMYDCRKILIAPNIQDAIISTYQEAYPKASVQDILIHLLISGPKVCEGLGINEVIIQNGYITVKSVAV